jgi:hypothetical protein
MDKKVIGKYGSGIYKLIGHKDDWRKPERNLGEKKKAISASQVGLLSPACFSSTDVGRTDDGTSGFTTTLCQSWANKNRGAAVASSEGTTSIRSCEGIMEIMSGEHMICGRFFTPFINRFVADFLMPIIHHK